MAGISPTALSARRKRLKSGKIIARSFYADHPLRAE